MTASLRHLSVLLTTEGTYPYHKGGVSTWCQALTRKLDDVDFIVMAVTMHPYLQRVYEVPENVSRVVTVPLWGTEDPAEYGWYATAADFLRSRWETTSEIVGRRFVPLYERFLRESMFGRPQPAALADTFAALHESFLGLDYQRAMTDPQVWDAFTPIVTDAWRRAAADHPRPSVGELSEAWRLLGRLFTVLNAPIPRTDLTHSAAAAFCGLPCVVAKLRRGTPYLLTEHGAYLREQYLNLGRLVRSHFVRWFLLRVVGAVVNVNYAVADQLSPVCRYNTRWERWRNVESRRIHVIYNGVDPERFAPAAGRVENARPLVVSVGLIFPLKGQLDLVQAAARVREAVPDVEVRIYGSSSDDDYYSQCLKRVMALDLERTVVFAGTTREPWEVYRKADVVAMASISEGFPYALIEAMLSGAAIVASDVGGVPEALGDTGLLVNPHDPQALGDAIVRLLAAPAERRRLGEAARARALEHFTEDKFVDEYRTSYERLARAREAPRAAPRRLSSRGPRKVMVH